VGVPHSTNEEPISRRAPLLGRAGIPDGNLFRVPSGRAGSEIVCLTLGLSKGGNVEIPYVFIRNVGPLGPPHGLVIEKVVINPPLDDSLFAPSPKLSPPGE
jgi:hypothetical protein